MRSIEAWREEATGKALLPAIPLDVVLGPWPQPGFDAVVSINLIHISPWAVTAAIFAGAKRVLAGGGRVFLYGPFLRQGHPTAPSNVDFDSYLRAEDPHYGIRVLENVAAEAGRNGFTLESVVEMPANNLSVWFVQSQA